MDELKFVLKTFAFTCILIIFMQIKIGSGTLESYSYNWLRYSKVSQWLQSSAAGGALAIRNFGAHVKEGISGSINEFQKGAHR